MKSAAPGRNIFRHSLVGILTLGATLAVSISFVACAPAKKNKEAAASSDPALNPATKNGTCEQRIRTQMEKGIAFRGRLGFKDVVERANQSVQLRSTQEFFVHQVKDQTQSVSVEHTAKDSAKLKGRSYKLSLNRDGAKEGMTFEMRYTEKEPTGSTDYRETFHVDSACELKNELVTLEVLKKAGAGFNYRRISVSKEGSEEHAIKDFTIPEGTPFVNLTTAFDSLENAPDGASYFDPSTGVVKIKIEPAEISQVSKFNLELAMTSKKLNIVSDQRTMAVVTLREQKVLGVSVQEILGHSVWKLPKAVWLEESLGEYQAATVSSFQTRLPRGYLASSDTMKLQAATVPTYDRMAAYFTVSTPVSEASTGMFSMILKENSPARAPLTTQPDELVSTSSIQTELPEVQKVKAEILRTAPRDRPAQIAQILGYLSTHYQFDHELLKSNAMRPLTTAEALQRGKGVCQHYSVIYTSIARALQIPTRIVVGLHFDDKGSAYHAWVESEIAEGVWQVIEPQDKDSLTRMKTRYYFPIARADFLEDKERTQLDYISKLGETKLIFSPAQ